MPKKLTIEDFILKAKKVHGDKYDYSKAVYRGVHTKLCIVCPIHGDFWQEPNNHVSRKSICPECAKQIVAEKNRSTSEEFIKRATIVHKGKYDYSKVQYTHNEENVCIICPEHGEFWQSPHNHLHGAGCPKCSGNYIPTTEEFVSFIKTKIGDKYDFSKVNYQGNKKKVCIICPDHGEFWVTPNNLMRQKGCPKCFGNYGMDKDFFIKKATELFGNKYDYSQIEWKGYQRRIRIICPEHGEFMQSPEMHLRSKGCSKCSGHYLDRQFFIEKARGVHGDKYDYSKVEFIDSKTPVCIICPKHGAFYQTPNGHLLGHGCRKCYAEETSKRLTKTAEDFLIIARKVHQGAYDYSLMEYTNRNNPIKILCPKHGPFMQTPKSHIRGAGCPMCNNSILEDIVTKTLIKNDIPFVPQKTFSWLKHDGTLHLDFFLYKHNIAIECQGIQHFQEVEFWGGKEGLKRTQERDRTKKVLCEERGIKMLYFSNLKIRYPYRVIESTKQLLQIIESGGIVNKSLWQPDPELPFED